ncbi:MAG TPA: hypothetical protein VFB81_04660 [Myxococcales bacterium]|nr:hypothetical protein [Myxococcales bacterium]
MVRFDPAARAASTPATSAASSSSPAAATQRAAAVPEPSGQPLKSYDGKFLGANGQMYNPASNSLQDIPAIKPQNGESKGLTVFVNGVGAKPEGATREMQLLANTSGNSVVGIYNATEGKLKDILQATGDKFDLGKNPAVDTLADLIHDQLRSGQPLHIAGYSQGGAIVNRAIIDAKNRMMLEDGMSQPEAERLLGNLTVETFAGAGSDFPAGPAYTHYMNHADVVPRVFGVGGPLADAGPGADVRTFNTWNPFTAHKFDKYMEHWQPPNTNNGLGGGGGGGGGSW